MAEQVPGQQDSRRAPEKRGWYTDDRRHGKGTKVAGHYASRNRVQQQRNTLHERHGRQRHDQRMDLEQGDAETVDQPDAHAHRQGERYPPGRVRGHQDRARQAHDRTDGKIDAAGNRHDTLAERGDHQRRDLAVHIGQVFQAPERARRKAKQDKESERERQNDRR
jgi:hypothetical protein